jgi:hypothetical protein
MECRKALQLKIANKNIGSLRGIFPLSKGLTGSTPISWARFSCARVSPKSKRDRWRATRSFRVARFFMVTE